jgi:ELWxxDGT repeat protein
MHSHKIFAALLAAIAFPPFAVAGDSAGESGGGPAEPLGDLVPGLLEDGDSWPRSAFPFAGGVAFTAWDAWHGEELHVFDGAELRLLEDLWPGRGGWVQTRPVLLGSHYYLRARDGVIGGELWRTAADGTEFVPVLDLCPGACDGVGPAQPVVAGGLILFAGGDGSGSGRELGVSDGTADGTRLLADVCPGACSASPGEFTELNGLVFFVATGPNGRELWVSDGTESGTREVIDLCPGCNSSPRNLFAWGDHLYFIASTPTLGTSDLWRTDGTAAGTSQVGGPGGDLTPFLDLLYFVSGGILWATDGAPGGATAITVFPTNNVRNIEVAGGILYASVGLSPGGEPGELWAYDGFSARRVRGGFRDAPLTLYRVGDRVAFNAVEEDEGEPPWRDEPWVSDGTPAGTYRLADLWTGPGGTFFSDAGGRIFFSASDETGVEPWISDGTPAGTRRLADLSPARPAGFTGAGTVSVGDRVVFRHREFQQPAFLWASDGTAAGTELLLEWPELHAYADLDGRLHVAGSPDSGPYGLWAIEGGEAPPELLVAVDATRLTPAAGALWFSTAHHGQQLWVTDGAAAGSRRIADVNPGYYSGPCPFPCLPNPDYPREMTFSGGSLFFVAFEDGAPNQLWISDGSGAGTVPLRDFPAVPGIADVGPEELTAHAGGVLFQVFDPSIGRELWWSDGTPEGTGPVADLVPGTGSSNPRDLTPLGGATLFVAREPGVGDRLWRVDGAPPVPTLVSDLVIDGRASQVGELIGDGSRAFFPLYHHSTGQELWVTDGTPGGTVQVVDLVRGRAGSYPDPLAFAGGRLFFAADDGVSGFELWVTDGTAAGTALVEDLTPGPAATQPDWAALAGDRLVFFGEDRDRGLEPWGLDPAAADRAREPAPPGKSEP